MSLFRFSELAPTLAPLTENYSRNGARWYKTPDGNEYPSVTTTLSATEDQSHLVAWRERIGHAEAEAISAESCRVGTAMHAALENFLLGQPMEIPCNRTRLLVRAMLPAFAVIDNIHHLEAPLYSDELRIAGRVDLIAEYDGILSIIDYKNSLKKKRGEWCWRYFLQKTAYAECYRERAGVNVRQIVTLVAIPGEKKPQVFVRDPIEYRVELRRRVKEFWAKQESLAA